LDPAIADLADRFWQAQLSLSPTQANLYGYHDFDDQIEDLSEEGQAQMAADLHALIDEAEAMDPAGLGTQDRISRELLIHEAQCELLNIEGRTAEFAVDPMIGIHVLLPSYAPQISITEPEHAAAIAERYRKIGGLFDQAADRLRQGVANGRTPPEFNVEKSLLQLDRYIDSPIEGDPFLRPMAPEAFTEDQETAWRNQLEETVTSGIRPAFERYRNVIRNDVAPAARPQEQAGVCWLPDGSELYAKAIKKYTSLDLSAEEIHQIGLDTMAELSLEYQELGGKVLGTIDLRQIYGRLRDDADLRFDSSDDIINQARRASDGAMAISKEWFGRLPITPFQVLAIPELEAAEAPLAYYMPPAMDGSRPGTFFVNAAFPENLTRYEAEALSFHEGVPGHHFQIAIAQEIEGLPDFRKNQLIYSYVEGWGLYCERLADEMGLYSGDLERMGMLSFDSWRAGRLVVDTGMHAMGWSRQQAIDYLAQNSPQQLTNIENEVDRFVGYFGQALSYMIGRKHIQAVRADAELRLAGRFDIRGFHDTVLGSGPTTLPVLSRLVDDWVTSIDS
jgi:uncharacterized protein (DUF885 family)